MEDIISSFSGQWLLLGDLNSISDAFEKQGGSSRRVVSYRSFRSFVENVGAIDLGFSGPRFTWSNMRCGVANIRERLDRGLCNIEWQSVFPYVRVRHLTAPNSDHNPILLDTHVEVKKGSKLFRFKAMWVKDESSSKVVEKAWSINVEGSQNFILEV